MMNIALPITNEIPILVRGFIAPKEPEDDGSTRDKKPRIARKIQRRISPWTLIFDTETTNDAYQNLRFGTYQLRQGGELVERGIFYDYRALSKAEISRIRAYANSRDLTVISLERFVRTVIIKKGYDLRASIVGFNLPFDISRIAATHNSAKGKVMKGGYSFHLLDNPYAPYVQIKHLSARAAFIQFALPKGNQETSAQRRKGRRSAERRGNFIDLKTVAAALFSRSFSLATLADFLKTKNRKAVTEDHGKRLTYAYLDYAMQDTQVTWECYEALQAEFARHALQSTTMGKVLSEASLGKAYLRDMGIKPFLKCQPDFPTALLGQIMSSYFGGRSEVHIRRQIAQVLYCDFLSMYPTVCTLMNLWRFVIANGVDWHDSTTETQDLLERISPEDLQNPETWLQLHTIVTLRPEALVLPVRAKYDDVSPNIGVNYLTTEFPVWYTLADVIASKFLTGKTPIIDQAITFTSREIQSGLKPIKIAGDEDYAVSPRKDDFYCRLINLRNDVKSTIRDAPAADKDVLEATQLALKLLANSTSYGIFMELIASAAVDHERSWFGIDGQPRDLDLAASEKVEDPGPFFHPLLGTLITGAARLMLALAEVRANAQGLDWVFCDTDSMAIAKPEAMEISEFFEKAKAVCAWFDPLNPYEKKGELFKIEDANRKPKTEELEPLYAFCISSKRYVLFNYGNDGKPVIRKASAHGLGHFLPPYDEKDALTPLSKNISLREIGVECWQYDLWGKILEAAHSDTPEMVDFSFHPALSQPAVCRYSATSPELLRWFKSYNDGNPRDRQVKPFNFLLTFMAKRGLPSLVGTHHQKAKRGRPKKQKQISPVAPYSKDRQEAAKQAFDRETGKPIPVIDLMTYSEAISRYHLHPEAKFEHASYFDKGRTKRRHIKALTPTYVGKESNKLEEQYFTGADDDALLELGTGDRQTVESLLQALHKNLSAREIARMTELGRSTVSKAISFGMDTLSRDAKRRLKINLMQMLSEKPELFYRILGTISSNPK